MSKPVFSLIAPAIRSNYYKRAYDSISQCNKTPFEMIFVGHQKPSHHISDNFHYIYSKVKPAQCLEIAARNAQGDYLISMMDDLKHSDNFLDRVCKHIEENSNSFVSFRLAIDGEMRDDWLHYDKKHGNHFALGASGAFETKAWHQMGGVDSGFIYAQADRDMQLRFRETRELFISQDCWQDEVRDAHKECLRASRTTDINIEKSILDQLWLNKNKKISRYRLEKVIPFDDKDILIKSQGRNVESIWD